uniref:Uncharacterized protein n=2 Tax=Chaetoceros debilis TaxID=122233 RepID=A0A6S8WUS5_9STRA
MLVERRQEHISVRKGGLRRQSHQDRENVETTHAVVKTKEEVKDGTSSKKSKRTTSENVKMKRGDPPPKVRHTRSSLLRQKEIKNDQHKNNYTISYKRNGASPARDRQHRSSYTKPASKSSAKKSSKSVQLKKVKEQRGNAPVIDEKKAKAGRRIKIRNTQALILIARRQRSHHPSSVGDTRTKATNKSIKDLKRTRSHKRRTSKERKIIQNRRNVPALGVEELMQKKDNNRLNESDTHSRAKENDGNREIDGIVEGSMLLHPSAQESGPTNPPTKLQNNPIRKALIEEKALKIPKAAMEEIHSNLCAEIESSSWIQMHKYIQHLSQHPEQLLEEIRLLQSNQSSAMHIAAWKSPPQLAAMLFNLLTEAEHDYLAKPDSDGNSVLHLCCANLSPHVSEEEYVNLTALEFLLEKCPISLDVKNVEGDSILHLYLASPLASQSTRLDERADEYSLKAFDLITKKMPFKDILLLQDQSGATPLHCAIANGTNEEVILRLIDLAPKACKLSDEAGLTPLHYIAAFRSTPLSIAQRITQEYKYGICHKTKCGDTPLHILIGNSVDAVWDSTRNEDNKDDSFVGDDTALMRLLMGGSEDKDLNEEYCPPLIANREKLSPMHCATLFSVPFKIIETLLEHASSQKALKMTNSFGSSPLHVAAAHPKASLPIIKKLGSMETAVALDSMRRTPLHVASQNAQVSVEIIKEIIELNPLACNKQSDGGYLPLHMALHCLSTVEIVQELVDAYPPALERESILGDTPLHKAVKNNAPLEVVKFMLKKFPAAIYITNHMGDLPLHHCAGSSHSVGRIDILKTLIEAWPQGASTQNKSGQSPLHLLVRNETNKDAIDLLTNQGAFSVNILNNEGRSVIDIAKEVEASDEIISVLESAAEIWTKETLAEDWGNFGSE